MAHRGKRPGACETGFREPCWRHAYLHCRKRDGTFRKFPSWLYRLGSPEGARDACFAVFVGLTLMAFWTPLSTLVQFCFREEQYSDIILIPGVSAFLLLSRTEPDFCAHRGGPTNGNRGARRGRGVLLVLAQFPRLL